MKKFSLLVAFLLIPACYALDYYDRDVEPAKSFHDARDLLNKGKYADAFEIHQRMFNNVDDLRPEVFLLHVHNLVYDWHQVALKYAPAMKSLIERRDDSESRLRDFAFAKPEKIMVQNPHAMIAFSEYKYFNEYLKEDKKTLSLFYEIKKENPEVADSLYFFIKDVLLRNKEYKTLAEYQRSPEDAVKMASSVYNLSREKSKRVREFSEKRFIEEIKSLIDIYKGNKENEKAEDVRKLALETLNTAQIRGYRK